MAPARRTLTVVSNRGPIQYATDEGRRVARRGAGGLVSALRGLIGAHDVTWIACAITAEDHVVAAEQAGTATREEDAAGSAFRLRFADPDPADYAAMYRQVANPLLWFIQHRLYGDGVEPDSEAELRAGWAGYRRYNASVAREAAGEAGADAVLVHDYQLYLVPRMLREAGVAAPVLHFTHIPWPEPEAWSRLPADLLEELLEGLLGADIVGFQTRGDAARFLATCADALPAADVDPEAGAVRLDGHETRVRHYPISIDPDGFRRVRDAPAALAAHEALVRERPRRLVLRVDRSDPSKNSVRAYHAFDRLLERRPDLHGEVGMLALVDPSRLAVPVYAQHLEDIRAAARSVNERHGTRDWLPIDLRIGDNFPLAVAAYREYDVLLVNPIADGMNLISKEAPLLNERDGAVALSVRAGSFEELGAWCVPVEPLDVGQTSAALEQALDLPDAERAIRADGLRRAVEAHDVAAWIADQLADLARLPEAVR